MSIYVSKYSGAGIDLALDSIANKVDKVEGKGLSSNDYTTAEKTKLEGIADGAQVNPSSLPNPNKITFSGAVTAEYDGSEAVNVVIPPAGGMVMPESTTEYLIKTGRIHPVWGYEYEALLSNFGVMGSAAFSIGNLGNMSQIISLDITTITPATGTMDVNYHSTTTAKKISGYRTGDGEIYIVPNGAFTSSNFEVRCFVKFYDTTDREGT